MCEGCPLGPHSEAPPSRRSFWKAVGARVREGRCFTAAAACPRSLVLPRPGETLCALAGRAGRLGSRRAGVGDRLPAFRPFLSSPWASRRPTAMADTTPNGPQGAGAVVSERAVGLALGLGRRAGSSRGFGRSGVGGRGEAEGQRRAPAGSPAAGAPRLQVAETRPFPPSDRPPGPKGDRGRAGTPTPRGAHPGAARARVGPLCAHSMEILRPRP